ncbi:MAG: glycosyltransferase family 4 protein [Phycisphaerae bacterium]|nr:glycosyltransferase family 4 protein [Phycisphaerae bacterium]
MSTICLVSYEIHPTTKGGCGVLLHHAAEVLLQRGETVIFLLDLPRDEFERFRDRDRLRMPNADRCRVYLVDDFIQDFPFAVEDIPDLAQLNSLRVAHALEKLLQRETVDFVEFFDYCGVGFYALSRRLYQSPSSTDSRGPAPNAPVLGVRLHNTLELIDRHGASSAIDRARYQLWGFERGAIGLAEAVLTPTRTYHEHYYKELYHLPSEQVVVSQSPKSPFPRVTRRPAPEGDFRIVFFGRMFHFKGVDQFVHAAVILLTQRPELRCLIDLIGYDSLESPFGGSYSEYLEHVIPPALRERFVFAGHMTHEQIGQHLNEALFAVFPNRLESFCYALHEVYDAGVPVIVNNLPAFVDFFTHEKNALVYDGTTKGLVDAMHRLLDEHDLRESLCRPYAVAEEPLGSFYESPHALAPVISPAASARVVEPLVIVLCEHAPTFPRSHVPTFPRSHIPTFPRSHVPTFPRSPARGTLDSLAEQTQQGFQTACLLAADPDSDEFMWWLGRPWRICTPTGDPLPVTELLTTDAIVLLRSGDRPDPTWLECSITALQRRPKMAFAGTWSRRGGRVIASLLDVVPELYPFDYGPMLTRTLIRTERGTPVIDLFDPNLGNLAEIGYLWHAVARWGPGRLNPQALLEIGDQPNQPLDINLLQYLLTSGGGVFADRLALLSGIIKGQSLATGGGKQAAEANSELERLQWQIAEMSTSNYKLRAAHDLGGRALLKIILKKIKRRLGL